ncbi:response regulator [Heliobacterium gestii]|uniref:Stage 0 sporulation protein A homolog n=1 Tax=Heliomicrobium gestii TaxID=2699 RepID=A0A845L4Z3_HELGE|nr:response regulator transcription factor [Heliomicrobium gestii]MBM7865405.1 DNA-binding response OmpR family regulator [Heliomicrobium gestii]MZP41662.1 response regulator [Heliomicrobium gestii]
MTITILVVDDEPKILDMVSAFLEAEGYRVLQATDGSQALHMVSEQSPQLVLLDWMLPGKSGLAICREIRAQSKIPIIMLTARVDEGDKVLGLETGADDYVTKPFSLRELVARIRSVLRRYDMGTDGTPAGEGNIVRRGDLVIDNDKFEAYLRDSPLPLTATEFKILQTLAQRPGVVYSRLQLMRIVMGDAYVNYERSVDTHVSNLRKKIGDSPGEARYILTVFGIGYKFAERL